MRVATSLTEMLPKTPPRTVAVADGAICAQMVRCGKRNCKCARGELHGPYFYRFTRDKYDRLHKQYVRRSEVEAWRELCERRREWFGERAAMRALCRRVVGRGGRVNWALFSGGVLITEAALWRISYSTKELFCRIEHLIILLGKGNGDEYGEGGKSQTCLARNEGSVIYTLRASAVISRYRIG